MKLVEPEPLGDLCVKEQELQTDELLPLLGIESDSGHIPPSHRTLYTLVLETVKSAVNDFVRYRGADKPKAKELFRNASAWLFCETDPHKDPVLGSLQWVCMFLDQDADVVRQRIRRMRISDLPKVDRRSE